MNNSLLTKKNINLNIFLSFLFVFSIAGLFYINRKVGADTPSYINIFNKCLEVDRAFFDLEPGFWFFNRAIRFINSDYKVLFLIMYLLVSVYTCKSIYAFRHQFSILFSVIIYFSLFFLQSLSLARMYMAASFVLISTVYLYKDNKIKSLFFLILSCLLHYSCLIMFLPWIAYSFRFNRKFYVMIFLLVIVFVSGGFLAKVLELFPRYQLYLELIGVSDRVGVMFFIKSLPLAFLLFQIKDVITRREFNFFYYYVSFLIFIFYLSYIFIPIGRAWVHFEFVYLIFIPLALKKLKYTRFCKYRKLEKLFFYCLIFFMCIIYIYSYKQGDKLFIRTVF